uniref:Uncharacterized protein n=1 Tax=Pithovirus LCPAC406 TaxID=2506599 RepID=A0A481ZEG6_9VIRU|nr:MAG: hypothetical protein LCPAC406_03300 [Pithovirus LCPAC406]
MNQQEKIEHANKLIVKCNQLSKGEEKEKAFCEVIDFMIVWTNLSAETREMQETMREKLDVAIDNELITPDKYLRYVEKCTHHSLHPLHKALQSLALY